MLLTIPMASDHMMRVALTNIKLTSIPSAFKSKEVLKQLAKEDGDYKNLLENKLYNHQSIEKSMKILPKTWSEFEMFKLIGLDTGKMGKSRYNFLGALAGK